MAALTIKDVDLFKIAGRSISGWIPSLKTGTTIRQPFCSQLEERLLLWLEYHPLVVNYARSDIDPEFATKHRLPIPQHTGSIYDWLTQSALDTTNSGWVTMDPLVKLVLARLQWSYEAKATDVQEKWLEQAAELLVRRHDTFEVISEKGPEAETEQAAVPEKEAASEIPAVPVFSPKEEQELPPSVPTEQAMLIPSQKKKRSPLCWVTAHSQGLFSFPFSVLSRVVSRWWSVLAAGEHGLFRLVVESCASSRTRNGNRTLPIPGNDGPGWLRIGVWLALEERNRVAKVC